MEEKIYNEAIGKATAVTKEIDNVLKVTQDTIESSKDEIINSVGDKDNKIKNLINDNYLLIQNAYVQRTKYMETYENNYRKMTKLIYVLIGMVILLSLTIGVLVVEL